MKLLFANIGWMTHYQGNTKHDQIKGGGSWRNDDKHEVYNFLPIKGKCYGYVQPTRWGQINLQRIDKNSVGDKLDHVLVIWTATHPVNSGTYVVGWYNDATVYSSFQDTNLAVREKYNYNTVAKEENCTLLPIDKRIIQIPRANSENKGFMGQSNIWYADSDNEKVQQYRNDVIEYIKHYSKEKTTVPAQFLKIDAEARKKVEKAAVVYVTKEYRKLGYTITSREKENVGWDLDADKKGSKLKLEVKGVAQSQVSVHITQNEYKTMMANKDCYRLCVVTNAIKKPYLVVFIWKDDLGAWVSDIDESIVLTIDIKPSYIAVVK